MYVGTASAAIELDGVERARALIRVRVIEPHPGIVVDGGIFEDPHLGVWYGTFDLTVPLDIVGIDKELVFRLPNGDEGRFHVMRGEQVEAGAIRYQFKGLGVPPDSFRGTATMPS